MTQVLIKKNLLSFITVMSFLSRSVYHIVVYYFYNVKNILCDTFFTEDSVSVSVYPIVTVNFIQGIFSLDMKRYALTQE